MQQQNERTRAEIEADLRDVESAICELAKNVLDDEPLAQLRAKAKDIQAQIENIDKELAASSKK